MITIHHLENSRSERVIWLMEELGLPYDLQCVAREPSMLAPVSFKQLHPVGSAPVIRDGDLVLAESGAILEYIIHRHGGGRLAVPPSSASYGDYLYWLHFSEGTGGAQFLVHVMLGGWLPGIDPSQPAIAAVLARTTRLLGIVDRGLSGRTWFAGTDFSAADIMMTYMLQMLGRLKGVDLAPFAEVQAYLKRVDARPAYRKAMEIAGRKP